MSARRFAEWQAYCQLEPFGPRAGYWQAGVVAATIANVNRTKKSQKAFKAEDFMPQSMTEDTTKQDQQDTAEQVVQAFKAMAAAENSKQGRKRA